MNYDQETWIKVWGGNKPMICNGVNDLQIPLPRLPEGMSWLVTREVTEGPKGPVPTYRLALMEHAPYPHDGSRTTARGSIDKEMYGERGVTELARNTMERLGIREPQASTTTERTTRPR